MTADFVVANAEFLLTVLRELSAASGRVLAAGAAGDDRATRLAIDQMRQLRAELQSIHEDTKQQTDDAPAHTREELAKLLANIRQSDAFTSAWCKRYNGLMTQEQLSLTPEGRQVIIDGLIPPTWNWDTDILTVDDDVAPAFLETALERGQKRVVVFRAAKLDTTPTIPGVRYLNHKKEAYTYFQTLGFGKAERLISFHAVSGDKNETDSESIAEYTDYRDEFTRARNHRRVNKNTVQFFSYRWMMQGLANLPAIAAHATLSDLRDKFINLPMVIISPGPSLDKNVHLLKQLKGKALLMAPAQSALALSCAGVVPDVIVVADPADILYLVDGFPMDQVEALLLSVTCHPTFYEKFQGKIITFNANAGIDNWISDIFHDTTVIGSGGSVSTALCKMGQYLKCNPIVLVGQDLALTNGKQYAANAADGQMSIQFDVQRDTYTYTQMQPGYEKLMENAGSNSIDFIGKTQMLPGYYGGMVQTNGGYAMFHAEFEKLAEAENNNKNPIRLLNCTEGGAFIKGFAHLPLSVVIAEIVGSNQAVIDIASTFKTGHAAVDVAGRKQLLSDSLLRAKVALEKSYALALRCAKLATQLQRGTVNIAALTKIENQLANAIQGSRFIALANQDEITNAIELGVRAKTIPQSLAASRILYALVIREAPKLLPIINAALMKLRQTHAD